MDGISSLRGQSASWCGGGPAVLLYFRPQVGAAKFEAKSHWNQGFPACLRFASWLRRCRGLSRCTPDRFHAHASLHMTLKYENADFDTHRQLRRLVYTRLPGSNLNPTRGGFVWQLRRISLNWSGNTRFSKTNCTKLSCTFQQTTWKF